MTEFEINKAVAEKLGYINTKSFDPCNSIEQAWEIMMEHNICVTKDGRKFRAIRNMKWDGVETWCSGSAYHKKPLVAAMLCFLEL